MLSSYEILMKLDFLSSPLKLNDNTCVYCGSKFDSPSLDHIIPRSRGGVAAEFNIAHVCKPCNSSKNGQSPIYWLMRMGDRMKPEVREEIIARIMYHQLVAPVVIEISQAQAGKRVRLIRDQARHTSKYHFIGSDGGALCGRSGRENGRIMTVELVGDSILESDYMCKWCKKAAAKRDG